MNKHTTAFIAHRGASHDAPENTMAAFNLAWQQDADGIEGDFRLTKDGVIVCVHDASAKRTAGLDINIAEASLAELRRLDAGCWKGDQWRGAGIPVIDEVLESVPAGKRIFIEIKCGVEIFPALNKALAGSGLDCGQVAIIAFDTAVIIEAKKKFPRIKTFWLTNFTEDKNTGAVKPSPDEIVAMLEKTGADGVDCREHAVVDQQFVQILRKAHKEIHIWTVDNVSAARRLLDMGVDSLTTNRAGWLKQQIPGR